MPNVEDFKPEDFSPESVVERAERSFKDFLLTRELAGTLSGAPHGGYIPAEFIVDEGAKIEIISDDVKDAGAHDNDSIKEPTVLIRRSEDNEVESIEFICSCGQKAMVKISYEGA